MRGALARLLPAGFRGQVAGILLLGLALSQALAALLYMVLLLEWQRELRPQEAATKLEMTVRLLESLPAADRESFARLLDDARFRVSFLPTGAFAGAGPGTEGEDGELRRQLSSKLGKPIEQLQVHSASGRFATGIRRIEIALRGGGALSVVTPVGREHRLGYIEQAAIAAFFVFVLGGLWAWLTWMVNAPLLWFARAAERVDVDVNAPPFAEQGPAQLKRAMRAFNQMRVRMQRFLTDRMLMLGAISHDLCTLLMRLRLRIETGRVADERAKMLAGIEALESMLTSTLSFVRGVDDAEAQEAVDLDLALQTACDLIADVGGDVAYDGTPRCCYWCKPQAMMRALTNVVANAAKYGEHTRLILHREPEKGFLCYMRSRRVGAIRQ